MTYQMKINYLYLIFNRKARDWAKSLKNRRKHYKILKQDFIVVVRQILLVRNHRQDFLHAKKRNPGYD